MKKKKIAIIGAGPMGLALAYRLTKLGFIPIVFESDDRVGGMSASFDFNGIKIERYYHFHCTSDFAFLDLLKELKMENKMNWVATKMGYYFKNKVYPWGEPISLLSFPHLSYISKIRYGLHSYFSIKRKNWHALDKIEAKSWIIKWIGKKAYNILWEKLFDYKFYEYSNQLSAAWIHSRIKRIGNSRYNIFKEKLGYLEGGTESFINELKNKIVTEGGQINLNSKVSDIMIDNDIVKGLTVNDSFHSFDNIVSTIPIQYIPKLIPNLNRDVLKKFRSIKNVAVVCVVVKLKKSLTKNFWLNINDANMDIPGLVEYSNLNPSNKHIVYVPFYIPKENSKFKDSNQIFIDKVKKYLCMINPQFDKTDFLDSCAHRYEYAQTVCEPCHLNKLPQINLAKGLFVADTSYYYPEDRGISESIKLAGKIAKKIMS